MNTLQKFLPWPFNSDSGEAAFVSNFCIWTIVIFFLCALLTQLWKAFHLGKNVQQALGVLEEIPPDQLASSRRELDEKMHPIPTVGELWHEFDETLVESRDGSKIYNTLDADHFFNTETLGQGVTESRFIAAVPGMLTAIGVFGTFVGLQFGLESLDLTDPETMSTTMSPLVAGAATAFKTSVWGILASLAFNVVEKLIEGNLINKIRAFQLKTDRLFDRTLGEQALLDIKGNTLESEKLLRVLGEQIGDKVQEGISSAIAPQMEKLADVMTELADRQASGAESALRDLVETFTEKLGDAGQRQAESMEKSAESLSVAMGKLDSTIDTFLQKVADQIYQLNEVVTNNQALNEKARKRAEQFVEASEQSQDKFTEIAVEVSQAANALGGAVQNLQNVSRGFSETVDVFSKSQTSATASFESSTKALGDTAEALVKAGNQIEEVAEEMSASAEQLSETTNQACITLAALPEKHEAILKQMLGDLSNRVESFKTQLGNQMEEFAEQLAGSSNRRIEEWTSNTQQFCNSMKDAVEFLNETINEVSALAGKKR